MRIPDNFVEQYLEDYEFRFDNGSGYTPTASEKTMMVDFAYGLLGALEDLKESGFIAVPPSGK